MRLSRGEVDGGAEVPLCRSHGGVGLLQGLRGNRSFLLAQLAPPDLLSPDVGRTRRSKSGARRSRSSRGSASSLPVSVTTI
jgi:hypothetical protein